MSFIEMMERIDREHEVAHEKIKDICGQSERLEYDDLISKVKLIVGDIAGYKIDTFIEILAEELENNKRLNEEDWDKTADQIKAKYDSDMEYWKENYEKYADKDYCKSVVEFKENMMDWIIEYSVTGAFASVECEYKYRKSEGLIG